MNAPFKRQRPVTVVHCPGCGEPFLENDTAYTWEGITIWQLDSTTTRITFEECPGVYFSSGQAKFLAILVMGGGHWIPKSAVISAFEGNGVKGIKLVDVYKCKVAQKMKKFNLPYDIEIDWGKAIRIAKVIRHEDPEVEDRRQ